MATEALNGSEPDRAVDLHSSEVPPTIRAAVEKYYYPGCVLMRCPRLSESKGGLMTWFKPAPEVKIEWWLFDEEGELIEAFWDELDPQRRKSSWTDELLFPFIGVILMLNGFLITGFIVAVLGFAIPVLMFLHKSWK